ncbi:hypothetical protein P3W85_01165 [Cupriavidus basilensis]|uniref:Uncharacterized protein n=1 Tax=Cupriavidus basilensis TaxID=68895 RepID=A0ABT6AG45_9BURK|nr:hypothetical protein [Cupriavidus basilensis]MDF3831576.1 hypothetical protein [Cupriavidus basilensis]
MGRLWQDSRGLRGRQRAERNGARIDAGQLCLLVAGVASARLLLDDGTTVDGMAGLSIGAYAAAVVPNAPTS